MKGIFNRFSAGATGEGAKKKAPGGGRYVVKG